jgi:hypothetical protein
MHFVSIYENRRLKLVEIVLRSGGEGKRENDGGGKSKILRYILSTYFKYHNVFPYTIIC